MPPHPTLLYSSKYHNSSRLKEELLQGTQRSSLKKKQLQRIIECIAHCSVREA